LRDNGYKEGRKPYGFRPFDCILNFITQQNPSFIGQRLFMPEESIFKVVSFLIRNPPQALLNYEILNQVQDDGTVVCYQSTTFLPFQDDSTFVVPKFPSTSPPAQDDSTFVVPKFPSTSPPAQDDSTFVVPKFPSKSPPAQDDSTFVVPKFPLHLPSFRLIAP